MRYNNLSQITKKEILGLIEDSVPEGLYLEYKREIKFSTDAERKELLNDVCAFANSEGGVIIYGIEEEKDENNKNSGLPKKIIDLKINTDETIRSLDESIRKNFEPSLIGVKIESRQIQEKTLLVIFIPKSSNLPHRVNFKNSKRFWKRYGASKDEIPTEELRKDFLQGKELSKRISEFRSERITKILSNETPVVLLDNSLPKMVLHIIPINFFDNQKALNITSLQSALHDFPPTNYHHGSGGFNYRFNFDGYIFYSPFDNQKNNTYTQVFRNSAIEALDSTIADQPPKKLYPENYEKDIIEAIGLYSSSLSKKGINGPCLIFLSLLNIKGCEIYQQLIRTRFDKTKIDRKNLLLPDVYLDDINNFKPEIMKPIFDMVWNACNYSSSKNYDKEGKWNPK